MKNERIMTYHAYIGIIIIIIITIIFTRVLLY